MTAAGEGGALMHPGGDALGEARRLIGEQRYAQAEEFLCEVLRRDPSCHGAMHLLALLGCSFRRYDLAEPLARLATQLAPHETAYWVSWGRALKALERFAEAERALRCALAIDPKLADAHVLLGLALKNQRRHDEAERAYREALRLAPNMAEAQVNLANVLRERGERESAARLYEAAAEGAPELPEAQSALAASLFLQGRDCEALAQYRKALALKADQPDQQFLRGLLTQLQNGSTAEAIEAYTRVIEGRPEHADAWTNLGLALVSEGRAQESVTCFRRALEANPRHVEGHINFAYVLAMLGRTAQACEHLSHALADAPNHGQALNNLGAVLMLRGALVEAEAALRRALAVRPDSTEVLSNLGACLRGPGRQQESLDVLRRAVAIDPDYRPAQENFLMSLLYADGTTPDAYLAAATAYGARRPVHPRPACAPLAGRRIRIAYLSPDLRKHSVAYFLEPALAHRDRERFEVHCYHLLPQEDEVTARLRAASDAWHSVHGLPSARVAERMRQDGIDIAIDLAGHTDHNGQAVLELRPAAVQIAWLGYSATTGLTAIDYRITDGEVDPAGHEALNSERLLRMPASYFCYRPGDAPQVGPLPAERNGWITFGSFNSLAKLSHACIALWARVLEAAPGSRLLLKNRMLAEETTCARVREAFAAAGVAADRLALRPWADEVSSHLELYNEVDIALDTYPYNGATTTCEALWMGVPVVSRCGATHPARMGRSILAAAGLPRLVADHDDDFVSAAAAFAADIPKLAGLRREMRATLRASALMDETGFTRSLETLYFEAYNRTLHEGLKSHI